jgi:hypothetical protein
LLSLAGLVWAAEMASDVLVDAPEAKVTRSDFDIALNRIPADMRDSFRTSPQRVGRMLENILTTKVLAARAREAGLKPEAGAEASSAAEMDGALAAAELGAIEQNAAREFDAKVKSLEPTVRETFLLTKQKYRHPERIRMSIIAIGREGRGDEDARAFASSLRDKILTGTDFAAVAREFSQDEASAGDGGQLPWLSAEEMDPAIAKIAFAQKRIGEISEPLPVEKGYVLIRLDARRESAPMTFGEAKKVIVAAMRADYVQKEREARVAAIRSDPAIRINEAAIDSLIVHVDSKAMKSQTSATERSAAPGPK